MPVTDTHPQYDERISQWQLCRDVIEGEAALKGDRAKTYLPPLAGHVRYPKLYEAYLQRAALFPATSRTFSGLRGLVERNPTSLELPESLKPLEEDATGGGTPLDIFALEVLSEVLTTGRVGLLCDHPPAPPSGKVVRRDAEKAGLRPVLSLYPAEAIRNWEVDRVGGQWVPVRIILEEEYSEQGKDEFAREAHTRYRVLELEHLGQRFYGNYRQRVFVREKKDSGDWVEDDEQAVLPRRKGQPMDRIPFRFVGPRTTTADVQKPPLLDIAQLNLHHYQDSADYANGKALCGSPTPWITGYDKHKELELDDGAPAPRGGANDQPKLVLGGGNIITVKNSASRIGVLSVGAEALDALVKGLERTEQQLVVLGARLIESEKREESGKAKQIDNERDASQLSTIVETVSTGVTGSVQDAADWLGVSGEVRVALNKDFFDTPLTPEQAAAIAELWIRHRLIAKSDVRRLYREAGLIPEERTDENIDDELDLEEPFGLTPEE